jgi:hypothetical protein
MTDDNNLDDLLDAGSRVEAAEAGAHHEVAEAKAGLTPREHVTASAAIHHHHPEDRNAGVVRARPGRHAALAAVVAAAVTVLGVVLLAVAVGSR